MSELLAVMKARRSVYGISKHNPLAAARLEELLSRALALTPSAFNMQEARAVLLMGEHHELLWRDIVPQALKPLVPAERFPDTQQKLAAFQAGYGTVLFFEDTGVTGQFMEQYAAYRDNFPVWAQQGNGMLQIAVWNLLTAEGVGATLQHYNPLIDGMVARQWGLPASWKLIAQMPFGTPTAQPDAKPKLPASERMKVFV